MSWSGKRLNCVLDSSIVFYDAQHTVPAVTDVSIVTPQVAVLSYLAIVGLHNKVSSLTLLELLRD